MGRLIDADKLIISAENTFARPNGFIQLIEETETAYDVEKVMDQLEENQTIKFHFTGKKPTQTIDYETAIDIVKRGGVE